MSEKKLIIINQAANYLTVGLANNFAERFNSVTLLTGSVHEQGESLSPKVRVHYLNRWHERPNWKKALSYIVAILKIWVLLLTRYRRHEVMFVSVPPMGYLLNLIVPNRFSMIIWDLYPDTLKITGMQESHPLYRFWSRLNRYSFSKAHRLFTISEVMAKAMNRYVARDKIVVCPIWSVFRENQKVAPERNRFIQEHHLKGKFIVQYSGNIGITHNVEILVDVAKILQKESDILFQIIGRGPRQPYIQKIVEERQLSNVQMLPFQSDEMFPHSLSAADLGVVILDSKVSEGSVPSKAYNLMCFGIPSLYIAGPDSELANYSAKYGHALCFESTRLQDVATAILELAKDVVRHRKMSLNAELAANDFRPSNAVVFVDAYCAS